MTVGPVAEVNELDALLEQAGRQGFLWYLFRVDRDGPEVLAGVFQRRSGVDAAVAVGCVG